MGSLFRTADAMGVQKLYLSGYTAYPPRREISKTAIGADEWVPWEKVDEVLLKLTTLKEEGWQIVGLEITETSQPIGDCSFADNVCLVVGHEVSGVPQEVLEVCDKVVHIPMHGKKESLNVSVAAGIALDHLRNS